MSQLDHEEIESYQQTALEQVPEIDRRNCQFYVIGRDHKDDDEVFVPQVAAISDRKTNRVLACTPPENYSKGVEEESDDDLDITSLDDADKRFFEDQDSMMEQFRAKMKGSTKSTPKEKSTQDISESIQKSHEDIGMEDSFWDDIPSPSKPKKSIPTTGGLSIGNIQDDEEDEEMAVDSLPISNAPETPTLAQELPGSQDDNEDAVIVESVDDEDSDEATISYVVEDKPKIVSSGSETTLGSDTAQDAIMDDTVFLDVSSSSLDNDEKENDEYAIDAVLGDQEYHPGGSDDESDEEDSVEEDFEHQLAELPSDLDEEANDEDLLDSDIRDIIMTFDTLKGGNETRKEMLTTMVSDALYEITRFEGHRQFFVGVPTKGRTAKRPDIRKLDKTPPTKDEERSFVQFFVHYMEIVYQEYCNAGWSKGPSERGADLHKKLFGNIGPLNIPSFFESIKEKLRTLTAVTCTMRSDGKSPLGTSGHVADMILARRYTTNTAIHVMDFVMDSNYDTLLVLEDFKIQEDPERYAKDPIWYCALTGTPIQNDEPCYALVRTNCKAKVRKDGRPYSKTNEVENPEGTLLLSKDGYECSIHLLKALISMKEMEEQIRKDLRCLFSKEEPSDDDPRIQVVTARQIIQRICNEKDYDFYHILAAFCVGSEQQSVMSYHHTFIRYLPYEISVMYGTVPDHSTIYSFDDLMKMYERDIENGIGNINVDPIELLDEEKTRREQIELVRDRILRKRPDIDPRRIPINEDVIMDKVQKLMAVNYNLAVNKLVAHFTTNPTEIIPKGDLEYKASMSLNEDADSFFMKPPNVNHMTDAIYSILDKRRCGLLASAKVKKAFPKAFIVDNASPPVEPAKPPPISTKDRVTVVDREDEVVATVDVGREEEMEVEPIIDSSSSEVSPVQVDLVESKEDEEPYQAKSLEEIIEKFMDGGKQLYTIQIGSTDKVVGSYKLMVNEKQKRQRMRISDETFPHLLRHIGKNLCPASGFPLGLGNTQIKEVFDAFEKGPGATRRALSDCIQTSLGFDEDDQEGHATTKLILDTLVAFWDATLEERDEKDVSVEPTEDFFTSIFPSFDQNAVDKFNMDNNILPFQGSVDCSPTPDRFITISKRTSNMDSPARRTMEKWVKAARKHVASKGIQGYAQRFSLTDFDEDSFAIDPSKSFEQVAIFDLRVLPFILLTFSAVFPLCSSLVPATQ